MQILLNSEFEGCNIYYINKHGINMPKREEGSITIHNNTILHGVTPMIRGIRYSLFLLREPEWI